MILFDTNYFIFVLDNSSINLVIFNYQKFGTVYTAEDIE